MNNIGQKLNTKECQQLKKISNMCMGMCVYCVHRIVYCLEK